MASILGLAASLDWKAASNLNPFEKCMEDPDYEQLLKVVTLGLNRTLQPQKVIIVGAGIAGLTAAKVLSDAGHKVRGAAAVCLEPFLLQAGGPWEWGVEKQQLFPRAPIPLTHPGGKAYFLCVTVRVKMGICAVGSTEKFPRGSVPFTKTQEMSPLVP